MMPGVSAGTPLSQAASEMALRIRRAFKDWEHAPEATLYRGVRIEVAVEPTDPLNWLLAQRFPRQVYWSSRDREDVVAGVGFCHEVVSGSVELPERCFDKIDEVLSRFGTNKPRYIGGFSFTESSAEEPPWPDMGKCRFWIPMAEVGCREGNHFLACNLYFRRNVEQSLTNVMNLWQSVIPRCARPEPLPTLIHRRDHPDKSGWEANVSSALNLIEQGVMDKVVLARKAAYTFAMPVTAAKLLAVLREVTGQCFHFIVQPSSTIAFMGTSPECLYLRDGRELSTEALAGTRPRDPDGEKDRALTQELLDEPKERHEQELVRRDILRQLHILSERVDAEETPRVLKLERKQHLLSHISATLKPGIRDADLLRALHPTPAVGGSPRANALAELTRLEPFSRGWYAAPVGCIGEDFAEFAVAIRSGLVQARDVGVYSGAGIVKGSEPEREWQEIENKISDFVKVTGGRNLNRASMSF